MQNSKRENKISRRGFLIQTGAATAAACAWEPLLAYGRQTILHETTLSPTHSGSLFNVARNRAAYQSSAIDDDHTAHLVTDGSQETYWESKPDGEQWLAVDLGKNLPLSRITLHWGEVPAKSYRIEVSVDGVHDWKTAFETSTNNGKVEEIPLHGIHARHVRLAGVSRDDSYGFSLTEFEVWGNRTSPAAAPTKQTLTLNGAILTEGWWLQCARFLTESPAEISAPEHSDAGWMPAVVPGTVLSSYLAAGAIPDPYYGNQQTQISEAFFTRNDFWYRNLFVVAPECRGRRLSLIFEGVNWKADVYLNGIKLGSIEGVFRRTCFDITAACRYGQINCLAILVHPVAHPGPVHHKYLGAATNNGGVLCLDSPTFVSTIGWNWMPTMRGRNIGIWNNVRFEATGNVILEDPWVTTDLLAEDHSEAELSVHAEIKNLSEQSLPCTLSLTIAEKSFQQKLILQPNETRSITINKNDWSALTVKNPQLWWPNGYGKPELHTLTLQVTESGKLSHRKSIFFGIRKLEHKIEQDILTLFVNGYRILCRGGNWGMEDAMLNCDEQGYDLRVKMHQDMNLVMIRNWVGMIGRDAFYDACDRRGLLIWDDFWLANPLNGPDILPENYALFLSTVEDKIRRVRHHASLALYCGRNEGYPPAKLDEGMRRAVAALDGTRCYISHSAAKPVSGLGPYDNEDPEWYFENRGIKLHSEQGIVCIPPVESLRAMMPEKNLWPINDMWAIHDYQSPRSDRNTERIEQRYGKPTGVEDYCRKAQMVNLETSKAIYECLQSNQGSGILIWMTQAAWPSLICQLYDSSFEQTAAYFGTKTACNPVHALWNQLTNQVQVANNTARECKRLRLVALVFDLHGKQQWHQEQELSLAPTSAQSCFPVQRPTAGSGVYFVKLNLSSDDKPVSENFYWASTESGNLQKLNELPHVQLATVAHLVDGRLEVTVANNTSSPAIAIRLKVVHASSGERVLPAMYEDNYFSLMPGEDKHIKVEFPSHYLHHKAFRLAVEGWNIEHALNDIG